jgi:hypothetical protein
MGFLSELGKAFMGQPLGPQKPENSVQSGEQPAVMRDMNGSVVDERGRKIIPDIDFKNLRSRRQGGGNELIVVAFVVNTSDHPIRINYSYLLKQKRQHNQQLRAGESRELILYKGQTPDNENENKAHIAYQLQVNGDVFQEQYRVEYHRESDGKYLVSELIDDGPIRDI